MALKSEVVKFRCTPAEKERLRSRAAREGLDISGFMRRQVFADEPLPPSREVSIEERVRELTGRGVAEAAAHRIAERELETV